MSRALWGGGRVPSYPRPRVPHTVGSPLPHAPRGQSAYGPWSLIFLPSSYPHHAWSPHVTTQPPFSPRPPYPPPPTQGPDLGHPSTLPHDPRDHPPTPHPSSQGHPHPTPQPPGGVDHVSCDLQKKDNVFKKNERILKIHFRKCFYHSKSFIIKNNLCYL